MTIRGLILKASLISRRQLHVISRSKTNIKPASPTPLELKQYNFPFHDRMTPDFYIPVVFFYPNSQPLANKSSISNMLKNSLSNTLSKYYPFAGRLSSSGSYVDCNDEGVHFLETRISCNLSEILEKTPDRDEEKGFGHLFPPGSIWQDVMSSRLMLVQLNHFSCGGIAIAELLPKCSSDDNPIAIKVSAPKKHWTTREIVFHNSKIAELKAYKIMQDEQGGIMDNQNYTRNELVTALLYRCSVAAAAKSNSGVCHNSALFQPVNMRPLIDLPLPQTSVGNLFTFNHAPTSTMSETEFKPLVTQMRKGKMQLKGLKNLDGKDVLPLMGIYAKKNYHKLYSISSVCSFPLYDEMNFGWGRPVKATIVDAPFVNAFIMMDTPSGDGISAIIGLEDEDMKHFLVDKELLAYASV